jgi:DinB superfamily
LQFKFMNNNELIIQNLANAPMLLEIVREVSVEFRQRRPSQEKWSAHEHACHLAEVHPLFFERLELMLNEENPTIKPYFPDVDDAPDALLNADLEESLARFADDRKKLVEKLQSLSPEQWQRTASHEEYSHYSIFIMFRHLSLHDYLHIYRIEELLLKKDW